MANQFGEQVDDQVAYRQAREALAFLSDESVAALLRLANPGPVQLRALSDEARERTRD